MVAGIQFDMCSKMHLLQSWVALSKIQHNDAHFFGIIQKLTLLAFKPKRLANKFIVPVWRNGLDIHHQGMAERI